MAALPPRRPGLPYGGAEERTPLPLSITDRLFVLEAHQDRTWEMIDRLTELQTKAEKERAVQNEVIFGPPHKPEDGMMWRVVEGHKWRKRTAAVALTVASAVAIALLGVAVRISYIVQTNKLLP